MKTIKLLFAIITTSVMFSSCTINEDGFVDNGISLPELMEGYDLWYVDYPSTTGNGDVPFLTRAFTVSFLNGNLYANNNLVGIGTTGNGFGIKVGYYDYTPNTIRFYHDIYGYYELEVYQISSNEIKLYDRYSNTAYYLIGYQRSNFDYDRLFYDNIHYFLQEYKAWEKVYTSQEGVPNLFDNENFLKFMAGGSDDTFKSSQDIPGTNLNSIYWDYTGYYTVYNISGNNYQKVLQLNYGSNDVENFNLTIINDGRIRLYHTASGTTYEFQGRGFIQYLRQNAMRTKTKNKVLG
ncbi:nicotinic acid mononucleotide adenyltransferase [Flavobacterium sp.]|uniref:nicotinic acid mononucleotide adenyltransferase n=1 Tax=Flavobacterium sp. TaxID=239 RepID=UPI0035B19A58